MVYSLALINKPVINSDRNDKMGYIKGYVVEPNEKRIIAFILAPAEGQTSLDIVPFSSVKSVYSNAVITENLPAPVRMSDAPDMLNVFLEDIAVVGAQVITDSGMLAGTVRDFAFSEKDGKIARLSLAKAKKVDVIDARHVLKITQARIIVSALAMEESIVDEEEPAALDEKRDAADAASQADTETETDANVTRRKEAVGDTTEAPSVESETDKGEEGVADARDALPVAAASVDDFKEAVRGMFAEMAGMMIERIGEIDPASAIEDVKREILEALKPPEEDEDGEEGDDDAPALELIIEEKIKSGASLPISELKETLERLEGRVGEIAEKADKIVERQSGLGPEPLREIFDPLKEEINKAAGGLFDLLEKERVDPEKLAADLAKPVIEEVRNFEKKAITSDDLKKQLLDFSNRNEERTSAINRMVTTELERCARALDVDANPALNEESARAVFAELADTLSDRFEKGALAREIEKISESTNTLANEIATDESEAAEMIVEAINEAFDAQGKMIERLSGPPALEAAQKADMALEPMQGAIDGIGKKISRISKDISGLKGKIGEDVSDRHKHLENVLSNQLEMKLAQRDETEAGIADKLSSQLRDVENRIIEVRERDASTREMIERNRKEILDEVKSYSEATLKPEDLMVVRKWMDETWSGLDEADFRAANEKLIEELKSLEGAMLKKPDVERVIKAIDELKKAEPRAVQSSGATPEQLESVKGELLSGIEKLGGLLLKDSDLEDIRGALEKLRSDVESAKEVDFDEARERISLLEQLGKGISEELKTGLALAAKPSDVNTLREWLEEKLDGAGAGDSSAQAEAQKELIEEVRNATGVISALDKKEDARMETFEAAVISKLEELKTGIDKTVGAFSDKLELSAEEGADKALVGPEDIDQLRRDLTEKIKETGLKIIKNTDEKVETLIDGAKEMAGAGRIIAGELHKTLESQTAGQIELAESVSCFLEQASGALGGATSEDLENTQRALFAKIDNMGASVTDSVNERMKRAQSFSEETARALLENVEKGIDNISLCADDGLREIMGGIPESIGALGRDIARDADARVERMISSSEEKFTALGKNLKDTFKGISDKDNDYLKQTKRLLAEGMDELEKGLADDVERMLLEKLEDQSRIAKKANESIERSLKQTRESLMENLDGNLRGLAGIKDIDRLRERIEARVGDSVDGFVEKIEDQLEERDREMEKGFKAILKNMEKLLNRGIRTDIEGLFSSGGGGGILGGLFGGQKPENPLKITGKDSDAGPDGARSRLEDTHIKRLAYLMGKRLKADIKDAEGGVLAAEGDVVDEAMIRLVREKQCTLQLIRGVDFSR